MVFPLLLALSLSVDALGIGLSYGLRRIRFPLSSLLLLTGETFLMMEAFLGVGRLLAACFPAGLAEGISTAILFSFGVWLCLQGTGKKKRRRIRPCSLLPFATKTHPSPSSRKKRCFWASFFPWIPSPLG